MKRAKTFALYFALLIMPGGTLLAALMWLSRHRREGSTG
jgi:hypothetical protein